MAVTYVNAFAAAGTSVTVSSITAGDLLIAVAYANATATAPTIPAGWTAISGATSGANTNAIVAAYKIAVGGETTSGTWTGATQVGVSQYRSNATGGSLKVGVAASTGGNAVTSASIPALTLTNPTASSWVFGAIGSKGDTTLATTAPTSMTRRTSVGASGGLGVYDTNAIVSSWTAKTKTQTSSAYRSVSVEVYEVVTVSLTPTSLTTGSPVLGAPTLSSISATRPWTFSDAAGLISRYSLKQGATKNGSSLAALADLGPFGSNMAQTDTAKQPPVTTGGLNGSDYVSANAGAPYGLVGSKAPQLMKRAGGYTVVTLMRSPGGSIYGETDPSGNGYSGLRYYNPNVNNYYRGDNWYGGNSYQFNVGDLNGWHIIAFRDSGTHAELSVDGGPWVGVDYDRSGYPWDAQSVFTLFSVGPYDYANGDFAEIAFLDGRSDDEFQRAVGKLAWDWGPPGSSVDLVTQLDASQPYKAAAPTVTTTSSSSTRPWLPTDATDVGLVFWGYSHDATGQKADGSQFALSGSTATTWLDSSGKGNSLTSIFGSPTFLPNALGTGKPGIDFGGGTAGFLRPSISVAGTPAYFSAMVVGTEDSTTTNNPRAVSFASGTDYDWYPTGVIPITRQQGTNSISYYDDSAGDFVTTQTVQAATPALLEGYVIAGGQAVSAVNGVGVTSTGAIGTHTPTVFGLGRRADNETTKDLWQGILSEAVVWAGIASTDTIQRLEGYLAWNNGTQTSLPTGHPYKSAAPTVAVASTPAAANVAATQTLSAATQASASAVTDKASTTQTLPASTQTATTAASAKVDATQTLSAVTQTTSVAAKPSASSSQTLTASSSAGTIVIDTETASQTLQSATTSASATTNPTVTTNQSTSAATTTLSGATKPATTASQATGAATTTLSSSVAGVESSTQTTSAATSSSSTATQATTTAVQTTASASQTSTASSSPTVSASQTLSGPSQTATATNAGIPQAGTSANQTLSAASTTLTASTVGTGAASQATNAAASSGSTATKATTSATQTTPSAPQTSTASSSVAVSASQSLSGPSQSATANNAGIPQAGTSAYQVLSPTTDTLTASASVSGTANQNTSSAISAATGSVPTQATSGQTLSGPTQSAGDTTVSRGTSTQTTPAPTQTSVSATSAAVTANQTVSSPGQGGVVGSTATVTASQTLGTATTVSSAAVTGSVQSTRATAPASNAATGSTVVSESSAVQTLPAVQTTGAIGNVLLGRSVNADQQTGAAATTATGTVTAKASASQVLPLSQSALVAGSVAGSASQTTVSASQTSSGKTTDTVSATQTLSSPVTGGSVSLGDLPQSAASAAQTLSPASSGGSVAVTAGANATEAQSTAVGTGSAQAVSSAATVQVLAAAASSAAATVSSGAGAAQGLLATIQIGTVTITASAAITNVLAPCGTSGVAKAATGVAADQTLEAPIQDAQATLVGYLPSTVDAIQVLELVTNGQISAISGAAADQILPEVLSRIISRLRLEDAEIGSETALELEGALSVVDQSGTLSVLELIGRLRVANLNGELRTVEIKPPPVRRRV